MNTWKGGTEPALDKIMDQGSIEDIINNLFESPTYGTRQSIKSLETITTIISLIKNYQIADCSHYNGYDIEREKEHLMHPKYLKTSLHFKNLQLHKNGEGIDCKLNDTQFQGMRINSHADYIQILFDFYDLKKGYGKKCVVFDMKPKKEIKEPNAKPKTTKTSLAVRY